MTTENESGLPKPANRKIVALAGGVGGAKLALGLYKYLQNHKRASELVVIGNTGDDLDYLGLRICPDIDTLMYTLAGRVNLANGWGIQGDTGNTLTMLGEYGQENWFWLGDRDFATHIVRTHHLNQGLRLTEITEDLRRRLAIDCQLLPMCDEPVRTLVDTTEAGRLAFQEYFVKRRAIDTVTAVTYDGVDQATISPEIREALRDPALIIFCPSNPYLSIRPILSIPGMPALLRGNAASLVVVSPIVGGEALKGPAASMMVSMGKVEKASALGIAQMYAGFTQKFVLDTVDADLKAEIEALHFKVLVTNTVMKTDDDKVRLAQEILQEFS